jgi:hypothetical protein
MSFQTDRHSMPFSQLATINRQRWKTRKNLMPVIQCAIIDRENNGVHDRCAGTGIISILEEQLNLRM